MPSIFNKVELARCPRSRQPFHELTKLTGSMGYIYPVFNKLLMPADLLRVSVDSVVKFENLLAPLYGDVWLDFYAFATPLRILDDKDLETPEEFEKIADVEDDTWKAPHWLPASLDECAKGTLWDYFGFPIKKVEGTTWTVGTLTSRPVNVLNTPMSYPLRAYNKVWNEYFRDEQLQEEIVWSDKQTGYNYSVLKANWNKDYFNTARLNQQLGNPVTLPFNLQMTQNPQVNLLVDGGTSFIPLQALTGSAGEDTNVDFFTNSSTARNGVLAIQKSSIQGVNTADINDWRVSMATQRLLERANITGTRYTEYLQSNFNVVPQDSRLNRPEFCGRLHIPVLTQEIVNHTDSGSTPQGNRTTNAQAGCSNYFFSYHAKEWTCLQILMCIRPKSDYMADGFPREWLASERFDFPHPLFSKLGQEAIYQSEICATGVTSNDSKIFGYTGCLDYLRVSRNKAVSDFRDESYASWTFDRSVGASVALNSDFIQCNPRDTAFAVKDVPQFAAFVDVKCKAYRPIPRQGVIV